MDQSIYASYITRITDLQLGDGGFTSRLNGNYRPDVTAWAVLILNTVSPTSHATLIKNARSRLAQDQQSNGAITISEDQPKAIWPTPLSIFAWQGSLPHQEYQQHAIQFLLQHSGLHMKKTDGNAVVGHDTSIPGWPWIMDTHSWVQPTALSMIALSMNGHGTHQRVKEGERMLLNRQLPQGGWNYGNTTILGQELQPFPESTGIALHALAGRVTQSTVDRSLNYLQKELPKLRTPISLCWGLLGLQAWNMAPPEAQNWLMACLMNEPRYGEYDPVSLCLLLGTIVAQEGLTSLVANQENNNA
ncbi:MAG: hypothetical protein ACPGYT_05915 [Nitrospirales bacterium]